jgi:hypothetical protein
LGRIDEANAAADRVAGVEEAPCERGVHDDDRHSR